MRRLQRVAQGVGFEWWQEEQVVAVEVEVEVVLRVLRDHPDVSYRHLLLAHHPAEVVRGRAYGDIRGREGETTVFLFRLGCMEARYRAVVEVIAAQSKTSKGDRV